MKKYFWVVQKMSRVTLQTTDGRICEVVPVFSQPCSVLYTIAARAFGYTQDNIRLKFGGEVLDPNQPMNRYGIWYNSKILVELGTKAPPKAPHSAQAHLPEISRYLYYIDKLQTEKHSMNYITMHCRALVQTVQKLCSEVINPEDAPFWHEYQSRLPLDQYKTNLTRAIQQYLTTGRPEELDRALEGTVPQVRELHERMKKWILGSN